MQVRTRPSQSADGKGIGTRQARAHTVQGQGEQEGERYRDGTRRDYGRTVQGKDKAGKSVDGTGTGQSKQDGGSERDNRQAIARTVRGRGEASKMADRA